MWQALLAAAVAGSTTLVAKHFLGHERRQDGEESPQASIGTAFGSPVALDDSNECGYRSNVELQQRGIFRFSSSGSSSGSKKTRLSRNKSGITGRRLKFGCENDKADKRSGGSEGSAKRFAICLKKRRIAKTLPAKCGSRSSKESSLFGWGLGVGIMYTMSAGKAEISNLSKTMDETSKVVQELKAELHKRKSAQIDSGSDNLSSKNNQRVLYRSYTGDGDTKDIKMSRISMTDVECPSSVLTEEPEPQLLEMDQLEAELATELQKLPWSNTEAVEKEEIGPNMCKKNAAHNEVLRGGVHELEGQITYQCHGVLPSELDQKLCHLLIEQQENQIEELESELHLAQSKLNEKEAELQALKDCVRRLTEFSLSTVSDEEAEAQREQGCCSKRDNNNKMGSESESRKPVVGMKRHIDSA